MIGIIMVILKMTTNEEYLGSSRFDKLRRISVIKPVSNIMNLEEGDEVSFYLRDSEIIIRKRKTMDYNQNLLIENAIDFIRRNYKFQKGSDGLTNFVEKSNVEFDTTLLKKLDEEHTELFFKRLREAISYLYNDYCEAGKE